MQNCVCHDDHEAQLSSADELQKRRMSDCLTV